jgi:branched-chain amino acid transport system ATP-binding protein/neutral amino acid transport system ATP-binding protein
VTLLACEDIVAGYSAADEVLKGVDFTVSRGEIVSIIGPNGAGKSTLLKVVAGILVPRRGSVRLGERAIGGRPPREVSALGVAFVPQEQNIFPTMTVRENLEMGGYVDPRGARRKIDAIFELDEPSAGLAPQAAEQLFETIRGINADGVSIAMVEQNALEALAIAGRGYILVDGRNSRTGPAAELARDPEVRRIFLGG